MMITKSVISAALILAVSGCSSYTGVGSATWHAQRQAELDAAYDKGKLNASEYYDLKNETDAIYQEYQRPRYYYPSYHFGYGYHRRHHY